MEIYTREERNNLYLLMLDLIKDGGYRSICNGYIYGLCGALERCTRTLEYDEVRIHDFPELIRHKPNTSLTIDGETRLDSDHFWFPHNDPAPRIKILEQAIEETK